jgi:hypothetical protein
MRNKINTGQSMAPHKSKFHKRSPMLRHSLLPCIDSSAAKDLNKL